MENAGYKRRIVGRDGRKYHLPQAEYHLVSPATIEQVTNHVKQIAGLSGHATSVLVSLASLIMWDNLVPV